jgi:TPR repeat protein
MYENATGTSKNLDTALMWYIAAARQGDVAAREKSKYLNEIISKEKQS